MLVTILAEALSFGRQRYRHAANVILLPTKLAEFGGWVDFSEPSTQRIGFLPPVTNPDCIVLKMGDAPIPSDILHLIQEFSSVEILRLQSNFVDGQLVDDLLAMTNVSNLDLRGMPLSIDQVNQILEGLPILNRAYLDLAVYPYDVRDAYHQVGKVYYYSREGCD